MRKLLPIALLLVCVSASVAHADTLTYTNLFTTASLNSADAYTSYSAPFAKFDTSRGTLKNYTFAFSERDTAATAAQRGFTVYVPVDTPVLGFGYSDMSQSFSASIGINGATSLAAITGSGTAQLYLKDPYKVDSTLVFTQATLTYNFTPAAPAASATPEPSSFALLGTGLLGVVGMVRRRFLK